jgi:hypothetical protein
MPSFFSIEMGSWKFFLPRLDWNCISPLLSLPHSLGWQVHTNASSCWLRWGCMNSLTGLALSHSPPDLSLPIS